MLKKFLEIYNKDGGINIDSKYLDVVIVRLETNKELLEVLKTLGGISYNKGIYRIHNVDHSFYWTRLVEVFFPSYKDRIWVYGCDWLGRQFSVSLEDKNRILLFDCATNEVLKLPSMSIMEFHEQELVNYAADALALDEYAKWVKIYDKEIRQSECVGYKTPLFLGGEDEVTNMEIIDMKPYWDLNYQIIQQINDLPEGSLIDKIRIDLD